MTSELSPKQQRFIEAYLGQAHFCAAEAARMAGYSKQSARQIGQENLSKPSIRAAIDAWLTDNAMPPNEILYHLTQQARGVSIVKKREDGTWGLDLDGIAEAERLHLVKKVNRKDGEITSVELYDAQAALVHLGRHYGLFLDRHEHNFREIDAAIEAEMKTLAAARTAVTATPYGHAREFAEEDAEPLECNGHSEAA